MASDPQTLKMMAAQAALDHIRSEMRIGIGTGSTAECFVKLLAQRVREGLNIIGVPTSERTAELCSELGVPLTTLDQTPSLDVTVDGADEFDGELNLIKGGGGALLREKIVAAASGKLIIIADASKQVQQLGDFGIPVEVMPFGLEATQLKLHAVATQFGLERKLVLRKNEDRIFVTDGGHYIIDAFFGLIDAPKSLETALNMIPGVVECGIFAGMADMVLVGTDDGAQTIKV